MENFDESVKRILEKFPDKFSEYDGILIKLRFAEGKSDTEIAKELHTTATRVNEHMTRILREFRNEEVGKVFFNVDSLDSIEDLDLPVSTLNTLINAGILTKKDLVSKSKDDVKSLKNLTEQDYETLLAALEKYKNTDSKINSWLEN